MGSCDFSSVDIQQERRADFQNISKLIALSRAPQDDDRR
jgi:hypothetical protein